VLSGGCTATTQIIQVVLPSGDPIWVSVEPSQVDQAERSAEDVAFSGTASAVIEAGYLPGFTETVRGVVGSVQEALERLRPDALTVEFGIEINFRTGRVFSVLAEAGGTSHVKVSATWQGQRSLPPSTGSGPGESE
jgi:hypothetical protein